MATKTLMVMGTALALATGCGGDSGSALQGIYLITEWTENTAACSDGPSILPQANTAMYIKNENFLGTRFLNGMLCTDVAECVELAGDDETIHLGGYYFEDGNDDDGWTSANFGGFPDDQGNCVGDLFEYLLQGTNDGAVIEVRTFPTEPFPEDEDGFCDSQDGRAAAEGMACVGLEVLTLSFDSELP